MARKAGWRRIKSLRTYTYADAARIAGVHLQTVRNWVKGEGLEAMTSQRPHLIRGDALIAFHRKRKASGRTPLRLTQFYCLKCRAACDPAGGVADCEMIGETRASLCALCSICETVMHKRIAPGQIAAISQKLDVTFRQAPERLRV